MFQSYKKDQISPVTRQYSAILGRTPNDEISGLKKLLVLLSKSFNYWCHFGFCNQST